MAGEASRTDIVLAGNEQLNILDRNSGSVFGFCGSKKEGMSEGWTPVLWNGTRFVPCTLEEGKRTFVKANEGQYVLLQNPAARDERGDRPVMKPGKNDTVKLEAGKTINIPGPVEFALWPGQEAEVIDGHQLDQDQYLKVRVEGPVSEEDAQRIWPIVREDWRDAKPVSSTPAGGGDAPPEGEAPPTQPTLYAAQFPIGSEFIVPGTKTRFFIPPTGMVVRPTKEGASRPAAAASAPMAQQALTADHEVREQARRLERECLQLRDRVRGQGFRDRYTTESSQERDPSGRLQSSQFSPKAAARAFVGIDTAGLRDEPRVARVLADEFNGTSTAETFVTFVERAADRLGVLVNQLRAEAAVAVTNVDQPLAPPPKPEAKNEYVRRGVRIDADEYVSLVSRLGRVSHVYGSTTVIPCIDQEFRVNAVTGTPVFKAIAIGENSGVLLRTLARMTVADARKRVPGVEFLGNPKDTDELSPGTELVVWKQERLVFPADSIEIVCKFKAEHILAGQARYVKNFTTGKTTVRRGEQLALLDPRKEEFIDRQLSEDEQRLWFPNGGYDPKLVPCITVPQGTAALVLGTDEQGAVSRKTLVGYAVHFLEWNERLATVRVSGSKQGEAKNWTNAKAIAFLWTSGNRINDVAGGLRSKDDCEFAVEYTLTVDFVEGEKDSWFAVDDYVYLVCDEVRSRLIGEMLRRPIHEIATAYVDIIRDAILGRKEEAKPRSGLSFTRCGARLVDINVRSFRLAQVELQQQLSQLQRSGVDASIATRRARIGLEAATEQLQIETQRLAADVRLQEATLKAEIEKAGMAERKKTALQEAQLKESIELAKAQAQAEIERAEAGKDKERKIEELRLVVEAALVEARSKATIEQTKVEQERDQQVRVLKASAETAAIEGEEKLVALRADLAKKRLELDHAEARLRQMQRDELVQAVAEAKYKVAEVDAKTAKLETEGRLEEMRPEAEEARQRLERTLREIEGNADARAKVLREALPQVAADIRLLSTIEASKPVIESLGRMASLKGIDATELLGNLAGGAPVIAELFESLKALGSRIGNGAGKQVLAAGPTS